MKAPRAALGESKSGLAPGVNVNPVPQQPPRDHLADHHVIKSVLDNPAILFEFRLVRPTDEDDPDRWCGDGAHNVMKVQSVDLHVMLRIHPGKPVHCNGAGGQASDLDTIAF
jgi:hypothetical protein